MCNEYGYIPDFQMHIFVTLSKHNALFYVIEYKNRNGNRRQIPKRYKYWQFVDSSTAKSVDSKTTAWPRGAEISQRHSIKGV